MKASHILLSLTLIFPIFQSAQNGGWLWASIAGSKCPEQAGSITSDLKGNIYVTGNLDSDGTSCNVFFGSHTVINSSFRAYLAKYDKAGNVKWLRTVINADGRDVATDLNGNCYLTGRFTGYINIGVYQLSSQGNSEIFVAKYDSTGAVVWAKSVGYTGTIDGGSISVGKDGSPVVVGTYSNSFGVPGCYVKKYDAGGTVQWTKNISGLGEDVAMDNSGNTYVIGTLINGSRKNFILTKLNSYGILLWNKWDSKSSSAGGSVAVDAGGDVYVTGKFDSLTIDNFKLSSIRPSNDNFLVRLDSTGKLKWARSWGSNLFDDEFGLAVDAQGNVYTAGIVNTERTMIQKYNSAGSVAWMKFLSMEIPDFMAIACDPEGNICLTGSFTPTISFGSNTFSVNMSTVLPDWDIFVAKFSKAAIVDEVGVDELMSEDRPLIYPNPSSGLLHLSGLEKVSYIEIYNDIGQLVNQSQVKVPTQDFLLRNNGVYVVCLTLESGEKLHRKILICD